MVNDLTGYMFLYRQISACYFKNVDKLQLNEGCTMYFVCQRHIQNPVKHLRRSVFLKAIIYFLKILHLRCLTGILILLCLQVLMSIGLARKCQKFCTSFNNFIRIKQFSQVETISIMYTILFLIDFY